MSMYNYDDFNQDVSGAKDVSKNLSDLITAINKTGDEAIDAASEALSIASKIGEFSSVLGAASGILGIVSAFLPEKQPTIADVLKAISNQSKQMTAMQDNLSASIWKTFFKNVINDKGGKLSTVLNDLETIPSKIAAFEDDANKKYADPNFQFTEDTYTNFNAIASSLAKYDIDTIESMAGNVIDLIKNPIEGETTLLEAICQESYGNMYQVAHATAYCQNVLSTLAMLHTYSASFTQAYPGATANADSFSISADPNGKPATYFIPAPKSCDASTNISNTIDAFQQHFNDLQTAFQTQLLQCSPNLKVKTGKDAAYQSVMDWVDSNPTEISDLAGSDAADQGNQAQVDTATQRMQALADGILAQLTGGKDASGKQATTNFPDYAWLVIIANDTDLSTRNYAEFENSSTFDGWTAYDNTGDVPIQSPPPYYWFQEAYDFDGKMKKAMNVLITAVEPLASAQTELGSLLTLFPPPNPNDVESLVTGTYDNAPPATYSVKYDSSIKSGHDSTNDLRHYLEQMTPLYGPFAAVLLQESNTKDLSLNMHGVSYSDKTRYNSGTINTKMSTPTYKQVSLLGSTAFDVTVQYFILQ